MAYAYLVFDQKITNYVTGESFFSPSEKYEEYPFDLNTISKPKNGVYELVRKCIYLTGYDKEHYGMKCWNPFGKFISPGDTVLIKPNWVEDKNKNNKIENGLDCLVTNPGVVRVIIDYTFIALGGCGRIILGDAPMQGCDLEKMFLSAGYDQLFKFYQNQNVKIDIYDLRKYRTIELSGGVISKVVSQNEKENSCLIDLGKKSFHTNKDKDNPHYKVSDYEQKETESYHHSGQHSYEINKIPLEANVIINMPKPKTHRLAGMTGAMKNIVGITYEKSCLPHRIEGDKLHGGDAYLKKSVWKEWMSSFDEKRTICSNQRKYHKARFYNYMLKICYIIGSVTSNDTYRIGSWYGNDTIWRTVADLNQILLFADEKGIMHNAVQRKIITIADMIICGEKEGPIAPSPKKLGMIMISDNPLLFDRITCEIMGFDINKLPIFKNKEIFSIYGYSSKKQLDNESLRIDDGQIAELKVNHFIGKSEWKFEAHSCWKGHIEKT